MSEDSIRDLVRWADGRAGPPPPLSADLAGRVLLRRRRRTRIRVTLGAGLCLAVVALGGAGLFERSKDARIVAEQPSESGVPRRPPMHPAAVAELTRLGVEADLHTRIAAGMSAAREQQLRLRDLRHRLVADDPYEQAQRQVDRAARIILCRAESLHRDHGLPASAVAAYRRVVELFPANPLAEVARRRLSELENSNGETL